MGGPPLTCLPLLGGVSFAILLLLSSWEILPCETSPYKHVPKNSYESEEHGSSAGVQGAPQEKSIRCGVHFPGMASPISILQASFHSSDHLPIICLYVDELKGTKNICCVYSPHPKFCIAPGYFALSIGDQSKGAHIWEAPLCAANTDVIDVEINLFSTGDHRNGIGLFQPRLDG